MYRLELVMYSTRCTRIEDCKDESRFVDSFMKNESFKLGLIGFGLIITLIDMISRFAFISRHLYSSYCY